VALAGAYVASPRRRGLARLRSRSSLGRITVGDRIGVVLLVALLVLAVFAPVIAPYGPVDVSGLPFSPPFHAGHLLGTDEVGYDVLSRVLIGLRASVEGVALVVSSGVLIGGLVGLVAGVTGGWIDAVLMRITDLFLALPGPLLAIAFVAALGPSYFHTLVGVVVVWWPFYARIMRGEIRALRSRPHLEAATLAGARPARRALRHLLPGAVPAIVVTASLDVGNLVITLASLSFLGLGDPAPAAELGAMSARGLQYLLQDWWVSVMPGIGIFLLALTSNLAGDAASTLLGDRR
jgi:peptide/nickel transport system permease protein